MAADERMEQFMDRINRGEKIESTDWMPDEYRKLVLKQIHMHGVSEIMGAYPEKEWVPKAPSLMRKLGIISKVQDEVGHGQLLLRVAEDVARPLGKVREDMITDIFLNKVKFHNVFHMETRSWADPGVICTLVDGGAIITQATLLESSYAPYARVLKRLVAEESFHMQMGENIVLMLADGTEEMQEMLQESINRWWPAMMFFFGPPEMSPASMRMMEFKIRNKTNEELRQKFIGRYVPRLKSLGMSVPDPKLHYDEAEKKWIYSEPDWEYFGRIVRENNGPKSQERIEMRRKAHEEQRWVREAMVRASRVLETVG